MLRPVPFYALTSSIYLAPPAYPVGTSKRACECSPDAGIEPDFHQITGLLRPTLYGAGHLHATGARSVKLLISIHRALAGGTGMAPWSEAYCSTTELRILADTAGIEPATHRSDNRATPARPKMVASGVLSTSAPVPQCIRVGLVR